VPHAGYPYSGAIAASAYQRLVAARDRLRRVVLVGPSHHIPVSGMAVTSADAFATPLGLISIDPAAGDLAHTHGCVRVDDAAHDHL
jgi:AmmeMemoRadiSam system protein B